MSLDDFDFILGNDFFQRAKVTLLPHLNRMFIMDETQPCYVHRLNKPPKKSSKEGTISTLQVEKGLRNGQLTYVIALIKIKPEEIVEVIDEIVSILQEYANMMPLELPKKFPLRRSTNHQIELLLRAKPPAQVPYLMTPSELEELRKQLPELLYARLIEPSRTPYGALVIFQKTQDGLLQMCVDYCALNKVTIKNKYPISLVIDLFDRLTKVEYFTKLYL